MIAVIDYGVGNLFSLSCSLSKIGAEAVVTRDERVIGSCDRIILPGVGAFADAAAKLRDTGMGEAVLAEAKKGKPVLGICLGMQLLFDRSLEYGEHRGLSLIAGDVVPLDTVIPAGYKIPHIGWNALRFRRDSVLFGGISDGDCVYFVHSFCAVNCESAVTSTAEYGKDVTATVEKDNIFGTQFHPEKSGKTGLTILKNFCEVKL